MDIEGFIRNFAAQFDDTDVSIFTAETKFKDLDEWSSLLALSIIAMVDDEYQAVLKGDDVRNAETINDLFIRIKSTQ